MKFFYWKLSKKEKFIRSLWTGLLALLLLYFVTFIYGDSTLKFIILIVLTMLYLISLWFKYRSYKNDDKMENNYTNSNRVP
jgi:Ca2+/Na+ antiporter